VQLDVIAVSANIHLDDDELEFIDEYAATGPLNTPLCFNKAI
jgi:hypothetical protein